MGDTVKRLADIYQCHAQRFGLRRVRCRLQNVIKEDDILIVNIVTPAVYPRLDEPLHFDIQSTGQKSHCVNITL